MSIDSKHDSSNIDLKKDEKSSSDISVEQKDDTHVESSTTFERNPTQNSQSSSRKITRSNSPKLTRSQSYSSKSSINERQQSKIATNETENERQQSKIATNETETERPPTPVTCRRGTKQLSPMLSRRQRTRSNSPRKTFSYLPPDRLNFREWKEQHRQIAKREQYDRIYHENRLKLERLAKIAKEPSAYPTTHLQQERQRDRHARDHRRKVLKGYIPLFKDNICIIDRLANIKGVYDTKKMEEDFRRHTQILKQDAANRQKARDVAASQKPFFLPKINLKS